MTSIGRTLRWAWLGRVPYVQAADLQIRLREKLRQGEGEEHLLLLEHPHVYTLGRNAEEGDVVAQEAWLRTRGVQVIECDRGGKVTYHGPGQLVGYPIVDLNPDRRDIRRYVADLESVLISTLADYGVTAEVREGQDFVGVWTGEQKIASLGIHLSRWLTTHGFSLNVDPDLSFFGGIVPCGLQDVKVASIRSAGGRVAELVKVAACAARHFGRRFERRLQPMSGDEVSELLQEVSR